jgi:hypothetical protein
VREKVTFLFNLIPAVEAGAGVHDNEMPKHEGGQGLIDKEIGPRRPNALALKRFYAPSTGYNRASWCADCAAFDCGIWVYGVWVKNSITTERQLLT